MKRLLFTLGCVVVLASAAAASEKPLVLDVWPDKAPGEKGEIGKETTTDTDHIKRTTNVTQPTLTVFRPEKDKDTGVAVVVAPGGGYSILAWDLEGEEVAQWLNSIGVTGIILKYRVPRRPGTPNDVAPPQAEMDAQRAISLVRSKAKEWSLDPKRIGMLGFSAGGHLTAWTSTNFDKRSYEPVDDADKESCRPDFTILIYPAYLLTKDRSGLAPDIRVAKDTPRMFIAMAGDDPVHVENAVEMYRALKKAGVPADLHVYASGGHGFGLRPSGKPAATWPRSCAEWLTDQGFLKPARRHKASEPKE
jgi:acetyl esterase/lipase